MFHRSKVVLKLSNRMFVQLFSFIVIFSEFMTTPIHKEQMYHNAKCQPIISAAGIRQEIIGKDELTKFNLRIPNSV